MAKLSVAASYGLLTSISHVEIGRKRLDLRSLSLHHFFCTVSSVGTNDYSVGPKRHLMRCIAMFRRLGWLYSRWHVDILDKYAKIVTTFSILMIVFFLHIYIKSLGYFLKSYVWNKQSTQERWKEGGVEDGDIYTRQWVFRHKAVTRYRATFSEVTLPVCGTPWL